MPAPQRTQIELAAIVLTLVFGVLSLVLGVIGLPSDGQLTRDTLIPMMAATPALLGAAWAVTVRQGGRVALLLGMVLSASVVVVTEASPFAFGPPLAVLLLLTADWTRHAEPAAY